MKVRDVLKKIASQRPRQKFTVLASVFIVYVVMLSGIFSYFHSADTVTNRFSGKGGSVILYEPLWDSKGQKMSQASQPGMSIPKNPYAVNDGQVDEYIRLKMTVKAEPFVCRKENDGVTLNETYKNNFNDNTGSEKSTDLTDAQLTARLNRRLNSILYAIKIGSGDSKRDLFTWSDRENKDISEWTGIGSSSDRYVMYAGGDAENTDTSRVYYFYYTDGDADGKMKIVSPGEATSELFDMIEVPIYKKDYLGVFDQGYTITIQAEAVPSGNYPDGLTAEDAQDEF